MKSIQTIIAAVMIVMFVGTSASANNPVIVAKQKTMVMETIKDINFEEVTIEEEMPSLVRVVFHLDEKGSFVVDGMSVKGRLANEVKEKIEDANIDERLIFGEKYGINIRFNS